MPKTKPKRRRTSRLGPRWALFYFFFFFFFVTNQICIRCFYLYTTPCHPCNLHHSPAPLPRARNASRSGTFPLSGTHYILPPPSLEAWDGGFFFLPFWRHHNRYVKPRAPLPLPLSPRSKRESEWDFFLFRHPLHPAPSLARSVRYGGVRHFGRFFEKWV
jgi:hypothetical protein